MREPQKFWYCLVKYGPYMVPACLRDGSLRTFTSIEKGNAHMEKVNAPKPRKFISFKV